MIKLALWIVLCLLVAGRLHARPLWMVGAVFGIWLFVPGVAAGVITGRTEGTLAFHPATWLVLACVVVLAVRHPRPLLAEIAHRWLLYTVLGAVCAAGLVMTVLGPDPTGVVLLVDQMLAPVALFMVASIGLRGDQGGALWLRNLIVGAACLQALIAMAQWVAGSTLVWQASYASNYWFSERWVRWMGTTDHPLVLSLLLCVAIPLVAGIRRPLVQVLALVPLVSATVITQSRVGAVVAAAGVLYVVVRAAVGPAAKLMLAATTVIAGWLLVTSPLVAGLESRLADDTGSTQARDYAVQFFADQWRNYLWSGDGLSAVYTVAERAGLRTSLESAFLIYAVGFGVVAAVLYFTAQVALIAGAAVRQPVRGAVPAALAGLAIVQTFSSLGAETLCGPLIWLVLALAAAPAATTRAATAGAAVAPADTEAGTDTVVTGSEVTGLSVSAGPGGRRATPAPGSGSGRRSAPSPAAGPPDPAEQRAPGR